MRDSISIGCSPCAEDCVQVEKTGAYVEPMRADCRRFRDLLQRAYPQVRFVIRSIAHEFGLYLDVEAVFDDADDASMFAAFEVEASAPQTWAALEAMADRVSPVALPPIMQALRDEGRLVLGVVGR